jgi:hypothetical protein
MSSDELVVTGAAVIVGPLLWVVWLVRMSGVQRVRGGRGGVLPIAAALATCVLVVLLVLNAGASFDVVAAPNYQFMYLMLGLAWSRAAQMFFPYLGLSPRDDAIERGNPAAMAALVGALVAVTLCYAGGNIGDGPGWWVVVVSAGLATGVLFVTWGILAHLTPVTDAVTVDRDPAAGVRLGSYLVCCGLILGRGVAGDWESLGATIDDFMLALPAAAALLILAIIVERAARPTPQRPQAPLLSMGVLPSAAYFVIAIGDLARKGWPV